MTARTENPLAYVSWQAMLRRCFDSSVASWPHYGGRGITVCKTWRDSFEAFLADMGERPSPSYSLERLDVNDHYEAANCIWIPKAEQGLNRRAPYAPNPTGFNIVDRGYLLSGQYPTNSPYIAIVKADAR